jgi:septal ring factor EnvC (AmiA/AmiB activator)
MTTETPNHEKQAEIPTAEIKKTRKPNSVFFYLTILFIAAFLLLLLSYLMQKRTNEAIDGMQQTVQNFQSMNDLYEKDQTLETQLEDANQQIDSLKKQLTDAQDQLSTAQQSLQDAQTQLQQAQSTQNGQSSQTNPAQSAGQ